MMGISCLLLTCIWMIAADMRVETAWNMYRAVLGALILTELAVHVRHFTNLVQLTHARSSQGISGQIRYAQWLTYQISSVQLMGFAVIYALSFCLTENWFFAGGSLKCLAEAIKHWRLSRRHRTDNDSHAELTGITQQMRENNTTQTGSTWDGVQ